MMISDKLYKLSKQETKKFTRGLVTTSVGFDVVYQFHNTYDWSQ